VRAFLDGLKAQYAHPALGTVAHRLTALASFVRDALRTAISTAKDASAGAALASRRRGPVDRDPFSS